jgi:F420-non-reducing hydrogenase iron-sulfur subunit
MAQADEGRIETQHLNRFKGENMGAFEPKIVAFLCNWCAYAGADLAGVSRLQYPANIRTVRVMCSGRVDPLFIIKAFKEGCDGVLVSG